MALTENTIPDIRFGTDGWRGVIAEDFTFANVRLVARAVARYLLADEDYQKGLVVGYDCRFLSDRFGRAVAEEIAASGIPVYLAESFTPTPAVTLAVRKQPAAGGVVVTASHNPWPWNGLKFKASYGGSAAPEIVRKIEAEIPSAARSGSSGREDHRPIHVVDLVRPYLQQVEKIVDLPAIAQSGFLFVADPLYGAARGCLARIWQQHGIRYREIHGQADPLFGGLHPEPIEPHIAELRRAVLELGADAGFATDGDADRVGAIDRTGAFIDSHHIFAILLRYLVEARGMQGGVAKTVSTTKLVDKLAAKYSLPVYETPVGFKYICDQMLSRDILIGGEESGGIGIPALGGPERDGVLTTLLLAEAMAFFRKSLGELVEDLHREFGPHYYDRLDLELRPGQKERAMEEASRDSLPRFAGFRVQRRENLDGVKMYLENGAWLLVRASGTEPLLRVYAEADSPELVRETLAQAEQLIRQL